jgi:RHS repeat-associated protein
MSDYTVKVNYPISLNGEIQQPGSEFGFNDSCDAIRFLDNETRKYFVNAGEGPTIGTIRDNTGAITDWTPEDYRALCNSSLQTTVRGSRKDLSQRNLLFDNNTSDTEAPETLDANVAEQPEIEIKVPAVQKNSDPNIPPPQSPTQGEPEKRSKDEEKKTPKVADPVNPFTGEFYLEKVDFELPSVGLPFVFVRTYKSGRTFFGPFGYNWDHNYNVYLRILNNGSIAINTGSLQEDIYTDSGDSILYNAPRGVFAKLVRIQNSDFVLTFKGGMKWYFEDSGFERIPLIKIEDTNKNAQQLIYNAKNQLETVIDTVGRKINFIYGSCNLLEALEPDIFQVDEFRPKLAAGKKYSIQYLHANNIEQLSAVITFPTPDFPNGLMTCYEYDEDQALPELRNNILRVIDAKGQTIVENIYGTDTTEDSFNRVVKQYFMGGEYLFKYTNIRYIPPFDEYINDAYLQTEFYEPGRPLKVLTFNFRGNLLDERFRLCADGSYRVWAQSYRYNKNGQMTEFYYANGMADFYEYYEYDPNNPASIIEKDGNLLRVFKRNTIGLNQRKIAEYTYENNFQNAETVTDEANSTVKFKYDVNGNLIKVIYPDATLPDGTVQNNCVTNLKYDTSGQLVEELSPEGRKKNYDYFQNGSGAGLVKKITLHDSTATLIKSFEYDALGNIKRAIDGFGNDTLFEHNLIGQLVKTELPSVNGIRAVYKFEYNEDRKIAKEYLPKGNFSDGVLNDNFIINEYFYDVASWLVEVRKYSNTASQQITKIQRDFFGNVIKLINPIGQEFRNKYDDRNLLLEEIKFSNTEFPLKTKYHYTRVGNLDKVIYPDGNIETFSYGEFGNGDPYARLISQTNHLGVVQEYTYGGVRNEITRKIIKDSLGAVLQTHKFSFDEKGRLKTSDINGFTSKLYYDKDNLTVRATNHQNNTTKIDYDGIGRTVLVTDPLGNRQAFSYDTNGNIISNDTQSLSTGGNYVSLNQQVSYDERNRPIKTTDPLGNIVSFIYDDRNLKTGVVNALGYRVNLYYDINGLTIKTALLRGGNEILINQWHRDLMGKLNSYQDAENNLTKYFYDERSNLIKTQYPDNSAITKEYDALGFLKKEVDCNGTVSDFNYNPLGQLTQLTFQVNGGALPTQALIYTYDTFGRQNSIARGAHAITKKFDNFNRLIEEKQGAETIKKIFDDVNNIVSLNFPDGRIDKYKLDELSRVKEVVFEKLGTANCMINDFNEGTVLSKYEYDGLFLKSKKYANNAVTEYSYDIEGRLSGIDVKDGLGNSIDKEQYLYDGDKRKRIINRDSLPNTNKFFNYDELSRLTESFTGINAAIPNNLPDQQTIDNFLNGINTNAATHKENYTLSNNDKRTAWVIDSVQYNTAYNNLLQLNSLSGGTNINYTYDKNGNRISDDVFNYFYDAFDNLVKVVRRSNNTTVLEQNYDGESRIFERKENNVSKFYFYDGLRSIQEKPQGGNTLQNTFGLGLDEYIIQSKGQFNYFYHQNSILSLNCITDKNCNALQYFDFSSFGTPTAFDSGKTLIPSSNSLVDILFSGRPYLLKIDKYDFRKRIYDLFNGLFLQRDLFEYADCSNPFIFCKHDPTNKIDPLGTCSKEDDSSNINKEYLQGYMFQNFVSVLSAAYYSLNPQAAGRAISENFWGSIFKYSKSEHGSKEKLEAEDSLHSMIPIYGSIWNLLRGGSGLIDTDEGKEFTFETGIEDATNVNRFSTGIIGLFGALGGIRVLVGRFFAPKISPVPMLSRSINITRWTTAKGEGLYGPYYHSASGDVLAAIVSSGELHGTIPRSYYGVGKYARVNAISGNIPPDTLGVQFKTFVKPDGNVRHSHFGDGPVWSETNPEVRTIYRFSKFFGEEKEHAVIPIMIEKVQQ